MLATGWHVEPLPLLPPDFPLHLLMSSSRSPLAAISRLLLLFGVVCYITSCAMEVNTGVDIEQNLPPSGGDVGPFTVDGGTVVEVEVEQRIDRGRRYFKRWAFITAELLDENRNYLTGFGGEVWHEAGYDDGYWREQETEYQTKITIPRDGTYYLRFKTESDVSTSELSPIEVEVRGNLGSSLPHHLAALFAFVVGGVLWWKSRV
jgi:hypothetical protein